MPALCSTRWLVKPGLDRFLSPRLIEEQFPSGLDVEDFRRVVERRSDMNATGDVL